MKNIFKIAVFTAAIITSFGSCKTEKQELGPKASQVEGIVNNWMLTKVDQIDVNVELAFQESDTLLDVSEAIMTTIPMEINFAEDGTYLLTDGDGRNMFDSLSTGTWEFDNVEYPSMVVFNKGTNNEANYPLIRPVRPQDPYLAIKYNKFCGDNRIVSYHLWFMRK